MTSCIGEYLIGTDIVSPSEAVALGIVKRAMMNASGFQMAIHANGERRARQAGHFLGQPAQADRLLQGWAIAARSNPADDLMPAIRPGAYDLQPFVRRYMRLIHDKADQSLF